MVRGSLVLSVPLFGSSGFDAEWDELIAVDLPWRDSFKNLPRNPVLSMQNAPIIVKSSARKLKL